jgi:Mg-chelatase subunit ChlD
MSRFFILRVLPLVMVLVLLCTVVTPFIAENVNAWSGVTLVPTHSEIDDRAYVILKGDQALTSVKFPSIKDIKSNDYVQLGVSGKTGPGPDIPGSSAASDHYYNPRLPVGETGNGPTAVKREYEKLVKAMRTGNSADASHAASWLAHFATDLFMPYHVQGMTRSEAQKVYDAAVKAGTGAPLPGSVTGPLVLSLEEARQQQKLLQLSTGHDNNFINELNAFLNANAAHKKTEDWFDPWYWDGKANQYVLPMEMSSHIQYEAFSWKLPDGVSGYHDLWTNANVSFDYAVEEQASKVEDFASICAQWTRLMVDTSASNLWYAVPFASDMPVGDLMPIGDAYLEQSIKAAATVWRASFTALLPSILIDIPDATQPKKLKVQAVVQNTAGEQVVNTQVRITVSGGTLKNGKTQDIVDLKTIASMSNRVAAWEVEAARIGYCTVKIEVIGHYSRTPDLQYAVIQAAAPGIVPVSVDNSQATLSHSMVFCLDNSGSMDGEPIIDAKQAGTQAVSSIQSSDVEMALYFFGVSSCDVNLVQEFTTDRQPLISKISTASAYGKTPLASVIAVAGDYIKRNAKGRAATIVLLTDGEETCGGDPVAAARSLNPNLKINRNPFVSPVDAASTTPIKLQVVGFNITSASIETKLKEIAQAGNGGYYSANNVQELTATLTEVIKKSSQQGIVIQMWWLLVGGGVLLLILVITLASRRRTRLALSPREQAVVTGPVTAYPYTQAPSPPITAPPALFCPRCGLQAQPDTAFCLKCGTSLAVVTEPVPTPAVAGKVYCPHCGAANTVGSAFCNRCGTLLPPPPAVVVPTPTVALIYCSRCGKANTQGSAFCNTCGTRILPVAQPLAAVAPRTVKEKKASWAWWFLVLLLLPGGLIAYFALKKEHPDMAKKILIFTTTLTFLIAAANMPAIAELLGK